MRAHRLPKGCCCGLRGWPPFSHYKRNRIRRIKETQHYPPTPRTAARATRAVSSRDVTRRPACIDFNYLLCAVTRAVTALPPVCLTGRPSACPPRPRGSGPVCLLCCVQPVGFRLRLGPGLFWGASVDLRVCLQVSLVRKRIL